MLLRRAFSLVEMLVVVAIIAILAGFIMTRYMGGGKNSAGEPIKSPIKKAKGVGCQTNLQQLRAAMVQFRQLEEEQNFPQSLDQLRQQGVTQELTVCPETKQPYRYSPTNGQVQCGTQGHERF